MAIQTTSAIALAKLATWTVRTFRLGAATTLPGKLARRVDPSILTRLSRSLPKGSVLVTGTNGKTTTTSLISQMGEKAGWSIIHNHGGANLIDGLTSPFVQRAGLGGSCAGDIAFMETDEAVVPRAVSEIQPRGLVVTNFFRDQLDRFGELDKTVSLVRKGVQALPAWSTVYLNADDPLVASLRERADLQYVFFGLQAPEMGAKEMLQSSEAQVCPRCGANLSYHFFYYAHHGDYYCTTCGFSRPKPTVYASDIALHGLKGSTLNLHNESSVFRVSVQLPGMYNLYNVLAATAVATGLEIASSDMKHALQHLPPAFGRMETLQVSGREMTIALVKNPTGCNEVLRTFLEDGRDLYLLMALNDNTADGTDISWIWDVDMEQLAKAASRIRSLTLTGQRAPELAVRLKYAGVHVQQQDIIPTLEAAFQRALQTVPEGCMMQVMPTYTAMLALREHFVRSGYATQYWKE